MINLVIDQQDAIDISCVFMEFASEVARREIAHHNQIIFVKILPL